MKIIEIQTEFIKLDQFLKHAGLTGSGVDAKFIIKDESVKVNGEIETRRGRKLRDGDTIEYMGESYKISQ